VLSTLVPRLAPGDSATVAFAVLAAPTLAELQAAAEAATVAYVPLPSAAPPTAGILHVYPNPSTGLVRVVPPADFGMATAQVFNSLGQEVARQTLGATGGELQLNMLVVGVYTLRISGAGGTLVRRLVRQ
jgi:serine protease